MLNYLCAGMFGLGWAYDDITVARHMFMYFLAYAPYIQYISLYLNCLELFWVFLSSPSLSSLVSVSMAPKRKSAPSWNPFHSGALSSSDPTPSSIRFQDEDAWKDFSENFSRWGVHLERRVILSDFFDTDLNTVIHSQGWESLCDVSVT